jgi:hypothetical protein
MMRGRKGATVSSGSAHAGGGSPRPRALCVCIGCGCDDLHACADLLDDPCGWIVKSGTGKHGVCTQCPATLRLWNKGQRTLTERAKAAVAQRKLLEKMSRVRRVS